MTDANNPLPDKLLLGLARDFKLGPLWDFANSAVGANSVHKDFFKVAEIFLSNISRLRSQLIFWIFAINFSREIERYEIIAEFEGTGKIRPDLHSGNRPQGIQDRVKALYGESIARQNAMTQADVKAAEAILLGISRESFSFLQLVANSSPIPTNMGIEAFLSSLLLGAWTAFESLAADLWEEALNVHPHTLAVLKTSEKRSLSILCKDMGLI